MAWSLTSPALMQGIHGAFWFMAKILLYLYAFLWIRFTFPRYRFDQLMRLGWRFLIPLALVKLVMIGIGLCCGSNRDGRLDVVDCANT